MTVDGLEGNCVPVDSCAWILRKAANEPDILQRSECGSLEDTTSLVCCRRWRNAENCGQVESNNDNEVENNQYPWVVDVLYGKLGKNSILKCTGSLINSEYVLTAAHCVKDMPFRLEP